MSHNRGTRQVTNDRLDGIAFDLPCPLQAAHCREDFCVEVRRTVQTMARDPPRYSVADRSA